MCRVSLTILQNSEFYLLLGLFFMLAVEAVVLWEEKEKKDILPDGINRQKL